MNISLVTTRTVERILFGLILATFLVPLMVFPNSFIFPFVVPKILVFRTLIILMAGLYILLLASDRARYTPRGSALSYTVLAYFCSLIISTFLGVDWYRSLWDNHERMLGLFTLAHVIAYYFIVSTVVRDRAAWRTLLRWFGAMGSVVMLLGVWQKIDPEFLLNQGSTRVSATLGNAIYYSGYGLFLVCIGMILCWQEETRIARWYGAAVAFLGVGGILFGGTRGTLVALFVGIVVGLLLYALLAQKKSKERRIIWIALAVMCAVLCLLFVFRKTALVSSIPGVGRLMGTTLFGGGDTDGTRLIAWRIGFEAWQDRPMFGWGLNNYYYAFNAYYEPQILLRGWSETWFDNAHNIFVNTLTTQGLFGLMVYLLLFGAGGHALWSAYRAGAVHIRVFCVCAAFIVAHSVHNFFVFENPTSYLYFFFFLAYINSVSQEEIAEKTYRRMSAPLTTAVVIGCMTILYLTNIAPGMANQATLRSLIALNSNPTVAFAQYDRAITAGSPHVDDIRTDFARSVTDSIPAYMNAKRADDAAKAFQLAYEGLRVNVSLHPLDIRTHIQLASLLQVWAQFTRDGKLLSESESVLQTALSKSPKRQQIQYMLSSLELAMGKETMATALLEEAIRNEPRVGESWWRLAVTEMQLGHHEKALAVIADAEKQNARFDGRGLQILEQVKQTIASSTTSTVNRTKK